MMRVWVSLVWFSAALCVLSVAQRNFLCIMVDDLGCTDLGYAGSTFYETPNMDALAASGIRFDHGYAAWTEHFILIRRYVLESVA